MIEISSHKMYIYIFLPVTMLKLNYGHVILPHFVVERILYILPQMSPFPSNALVKYNVGISCSASLKALYLYGLFIFQRLLSRLEWPVHCSLASWKGLRGREMSNKSVSWLLGTPRVCLVSLEWEVWRNFIIFLLWRSLL